MPDSPIFGRDKTLFFLSLFLSYNFLTFFSFSKLFLSSIAGFFWPSLSSSYKSYGKLHYKHLPHRCLTINAGTSKFCTENLEAEIVPVHLSLPHSMCRCLPVLTMASFQRLPSLTNLTEKEKFLENSLACHLEAKRWC